VSNRFDDVLVKASRSLPPKHLAALEPWDLANLVPYRDEYLSGFAAETYQVDLVEGFEIAKTIMAGTSQLTIRADIGGDHQRIHHVEPTTAASRSSTCCCRSGSAPTATTNASSASSSTPAPAKCRASARGAR
jgi:hypothetical protein